jgi:hypothetical protein
MTYHTAKHIVKVQQIPNGKYVRSELSSQFYIRGEIRARVLEETR